jgi:hypothetical protein
MSGEVQFYLVAVPAVILFGLSKGGFLRLVHRAPPERFYAVILGLTFLIGVKLTYDAVLALA